MIGIPGDRRDEDQREYGAIAAGAFDEIIVREDKNLRGRAAGRDRGQRHRRRPRRAGRRRRPGPAAPTRSSRRWPRSGPRCAGRSRATSSSVRRRRGRRLPRGDVRRGVARRDGLRGSGRARGARGLRLERGSAIARWSSRPRGGPCGASAGRLPCLDDAWRAITLVATSGWSALASCSSSCSRRACLRPPAQCGQKQPCADYDAAYYAANQAAAIAERRRVAASEPDTRRSSLPQSVEEVAQASGVIMGRCRSRPTRERSGGAVRRTVRMMPTRISRDSTMSAMPATVSTGVTSEPRPSVAPGGRGRRCIRPPTGHEATEATPCGSTACRDRRGPRPTPYGAAATTPATMRLIEPRHARAACLDQSPRRSAWRSAATCRTVGPVVGRGPGRRAAADVERLGRRLSTR